MLFANLRSITEQLKCAFYQSGYVKHLLRFAESLC